MEWPPLAGASPRAESHRMCRHGRSKPVAVEIETLRDVCRRYSALRVDSHCNGRISGGTDNRPMSHPSVTARLAALAPDQRLAATAAPGPVLCVAPAGSGKTTTLVARIAWLIDEGAARRNRLRDHVQQARR